METGDGGIGGRIACYMGVGLGKWVMESYMVSKLGGCRGEIEPLGSFPVGLGGGGCALIRSFLSAFHHPAADNLGCDAHNPHSCRDYHAALGFSCSVTLGTFRRRQLNGKVWLHGRGG